MKLSQSLEDRELSDTVLDAVKDLTDKNLDELIEKYNSQLRKDGKYLDNSDVAKLKKVLRSEKLKIKMTISSAITPKLLEDWDIYPISVNQTTFDSTSSDTTTAPKDEKFREERKKRVEAQA